MRSRLLIIIIAAGMIMAACGSDDGDSAVDTGEVAAGTEAAASDTEARSEGGGIYGEPVTDDTSAGAGTASTGSESVGDTAAVAPVAVATTDLGDALVDTGGFVLYGFTPDEGGTPTCEDACADLWPPVVTESADLPPGLDAAVFTVVERPDGSFQLAAGGWPLYRYAGDIAPGDTTGQGSGGVWFAVAPDGSLIT